MYIGTQACFPDHLRKAGTAQTIPVLSPQATTQTNKSRKLIRYEVKILRHNRILMREDNLEDATVKELHLGQEWIAKSTFRSRKGP